MCLVIGENIRNYRKSKNISLDELAEQLELSQGYVGLVERGRGCLTPFTLLKSCNTFDCMLNDMVENKIG